MGIPIKELVATSLVIFFGERIPSNVVIMCQDNANPCQTHHELAMQFNMGSFNSIYGLLLNQRFSVLPERISDFYIRFPTVLLPSFAHSLIWQYAMWSTTDFFSCTTVHVATTSVVSFPSTPAFCCF